MSNKKSVRIIGGPLDGKEWLVDVNCGYFVVPSIIKQPMSKVLDFGEPVEVVADCENLIYTLHEWLVAGDTTQWYATLEGASHYTILDSLWRKYKQFKPIQDRLEKYEVQVALDNVTIEQLERNNGHLEDELAAAESIITLLELTHGDIVDDVRRALETDPDE